MRPTETHTLRGRAQQRTEGDADAIDTRGEWTHLEAQLNRI